MVLISWFVLVLIMWFVLVLITWFVVVLFTWIVLLLITWFVLLLITWFVLVLKLGELENLEAVFLRGLLPPPEVHIWREPEIVTLTFGNRNCLSSSFRSTFVKHFDSGKYFYLHKQRQYIWIRNTDYCSYSKSFLSFQSNVRFYQQNHFHFWIVIAKFGPCPAPLIPLRSTSLIRLSAVKEKKNKII